MQWTQRSVVGLTIELVDSKNIEEYGFARGGIVAITVGRKNSFLVAPVGYWKIVSGRLRITGEENGEDVHDELTLISRDASKIVVRRRSGEIATFKIHEHQNA